MADTRTGGDKILSLEEANDICGCDFIASAVHRNHRELTLRKHEHLTTFDQRGIRGVLELLEELDAGFDDEVNLRWPDLDIFVAQHNWTDPNSVYRLCVYLEEQLRAWHERGKLTSALDAISGLAAHARER